VFDGEAVHRVLLESIRRLGKIQTLRMLDASGKGAVQSAQEILATVAKEKSNR
jgi:hypothetical protein